MVEDCWVIDIAKLPTERFLDQYVGSMHLTATWPTGEVTKLKLRTATTCPNYGQYPRSHSVIEHPALKLSPHDTTTDVETNLESWSGSAAPELDIEQLRLFRT